MTATDVYAAREKALHAARSEFPQSHNWDSDVSIAQCVLSALIAAQTVLKDELGEDSRFENCMGIVASAFFLYFVGSDLTDANPHSVGGDALLDFAAAVHGVQALLDAKIYFTDGAAAVADSALSTSKAMHAVIFPTKENHSDH